MEESTIYCPSDYVDGEDGSGNLIAGSWRNATAATGMTPVGAVSGTGIDVIGIVNPLMSIYIT